MDPGGRQRNGLTRGDLLTAIAIAAMTLVLRLIYLFHSPDFAWPHSILYEGDAPIWARWALLLDQGQPFEYDLAFRTPGVAWLLHWMGLSAAPFTAAKILWCVFSAATSAALYLVLARWFSRRAGLIAAVLCTISFGSFVLSTSLNNETPYALILVLIAGATLSWIDRPIWLLSLLLGLLHGVALLLRAEHSLLLAMCMIYAAYRVWRPNNAPMLVASLYDANPLRGRVPLLQVAGRSALLLAVVLAVCAPWAIRSHAAMQRFNNDAPPIPYETARPPWTPSAIASLERLPAFARAGNFAFLSALSRQNGKTAVDEPDVKAFFEQQWGYTPEPLSEWSLVSLKGPLDFALANHPDSVGGFSRIGLRDSHDADANFSLARPSHTRLVNHGYAIGLDYIRGDFGRWLKQVREKLTRFQEGATLGLFANDWPFDGMHVRHAIDLATPVRGSAPVWSAAVVLSMLAGAVVACRRRGGMIWLLIVAYKLAVAFAFYGYARQAVSIAPALFALTALALDALGCGRSCRFNIGPSTQVIVRWIKGVALALLFAMAFYHAWFPPMFSARISQPNGQLTNAPQWGKGSFESFDELILEPGRNEWPTSKR